MDEDPYGNHLEGKSKRDRRKASQQIDNENQNQNPNVEETQQQEELPPEQAVQGRGLMARG